MKFLAAILMVCGLGLTVIYAQTDGFTVVTTEAARRAAILQHPKAVPDIVIRSASAMPGATLLRDLQSDGRVAIVNFMYTRCFSLCLAMGSQFQQVQNDIGRRGLVNKVRLLSISFDQGDTSEMLRRYEQRMGFDTSIWSAVAIADAVSGKALLDAFGIVVVPAPLGQYEHNAAYHIVTPDGRFTRIIDMDDADTLLDHALAQMVQGGHN